jgi:DNA-directed RNA polymerase subunit RPC12/RpoP
MASSNPQSSPQYIGVECRVCGTRMYGGPEQVGHHLKCPDCGARTLLRPPPKPKPKSVPAAMEGEQYELWDVDSQPLPADLIARQPTYIAVRCRRCETLMYATEAQVGQTIACPDCGAKHVVPPPAKSKPKPSGVNLDAETPKLDPAAAPGTRPSVLPVATRGMDFEEAQDAAFARAREKSQRTGKPMEIDRRGRPVMPRWPLLSGVLLFPFYAGCLTRWAALTLGLLLSGGLMLDGIPAWVNWTGDVAGAKEAFGGLIETIIGAVCAVIWLAAASNILIAIVSQSAVGNDRIAEWPSMNFIASMSEMLPVGVAVIFTTAPGWMLGMLVAREPWHLPVLMGASFLLGFPITLLSQLANNSTWELIDLKVLGAMVRCPLSMIVFYIESAALAAVCVWAAIAVAPIHEWLPLALAPLYLGCLLLYARLMGRLAWRLSEKMPLEATNDD